jgi:hypothetical protein
MQAGSMRRRAAMREVWCWKQSLAMLQGLISCHLSKLHIIKIVGVTKF